MSIKEIVDNYLFDWEEKMNKNLPPLKSTAFIDFGTYDHEKDTIEVVIRVHEEYETTVLARANIATDWLSQHLDEMDEMRKKLYEIAIRTPSGYKGEAVKKYLNQVFVEDFLGSWNVIDNRLFI